MEVQYWRGQLAVGPTAMKLLEEGGLCVIDSRDYFNFTERLKHLEASLQATSDLNARLQQDLAEAARDQQDRKFNFGTQPVAPAAGVIMTVRPGRRRNNRKKGAA